MSTCGDAERVAQWASADYLDWWKLLDHLRLLALDVLGDPDGDQGPRLQTPEERAAAAELVVTCLELIYGPDLLSPWSYWGAVVQAELDGQGRWFLSGAQVADLLRPRCTHHFPQAAGTLPP